MTTVLEPVDVLLVERSTKFAELERAAIQNTGLAQHVAWVQDGEQALCYLYHLSPFEQRSFEEPRLLLVDCNLRNLSGLDLVREVRAEREFSRLAIVMTSTTHDLELAQECLAAGANAFVTKVSEETRYFTHIEIVARYWLERRGAVISRDNGIREQKGHSQAWQSSERYWH